MLAFQHLRGKLFFQESLADYTSWRVGGPADYLYIPADAEDVSYFLKQLPSSIPVLWLGLGSNVLIRDGGVEGAVIVTQGGLQKMEVLSSNQLRAEAGVACGQVARFAARQGLTGIEFMAGIPGTVGGALSMNAGCFGGETWRTVSQVETINRLGERKIRFPTDYETSYRHVGRPENEAFLSGYFQLSSGDKTDSLEKIRTLLEKRNASQPTGLPNCGSVFRNPPGDFAARLIESCHLKNKKIGGAYVSEKHANFIINDGHATAEDIELLISYVASAVEKQYKIQLTREVCVMGRKNIA